ncbi:MAG: hypothetical protein KAJ39_09500 [Gammaproteobacteria bacterium]|nr:hypothetical protein [Gammaproteobacteria bacterium]
MADIPILTEYTTEITTDKKDRTRAIESGQTSFLSKVGKVVAYFSKMPDLTNFTWFLIPIYLAISRT